MVGPANDLDLQKARSGAGIKLFAQSIGSWVE